MWHFDAIDTHESTSAGQQSSVLERIAKLAACTATQQQYTFGPRLILVGHNEFYQA